MNGARGDEILVRRAYRGVALQAAGLVGLAMLLLVVLVTLVVVRGQSTAADTLLRSTLTGADDVGDPPPGTWLVFEQSGRSVSSPGLPAALTPTLAGLRTRATTSTVLSDVTAGDRPYRVATRLRGGQTAQVVLDLTPAHDQRDRLLEVMGVAASLALLFAGVVGALLGRRAVRPLAQALTLQRMFVADASHELRTPLTLLSTRAQVLDLALQASDLDPASRADSAGVVRDVQRLGEVVEDLLLAADPRGQEPRAVLDLVALVALVLDSARAHLAGGQVRTSFQVGPGVHRVLGSAPALRRAVLALIDNAVGHTPPGGTVTVTVRRGRHEVVVAVSDTGPGIDPAAAQDVLRRFHSGGHRAGRAHYGLGLALTRDVADRHGGQLRLVPATTGACFELSLPAHDPKERPRMPRHRGTRDAEPNRDLALDPTELLSWSPPPPPP